MERSRSRKDIIQQLQYDQEHTIDRLDHAGPYTTFEEWREIGTPGNPDFQTGWVNFGGTNQETCAFWKSSSGIVLLRGIIKNGTTGIIFRLPEGYRPKYGFKRFAVVSAGAFGYVSIEPDGDVILQSGSSTYVDLCQCVFRAEQ